MTNKVYINLATGMAHAAPAFDAPPPKVVIKLRSKQDLEFVFFTAGEPFPVTATQSDNTFTSVDHGLSDGDRIIFPLLTGGYGLTAAVAPYYVRDKTVDTFKIALTPGGAAIDFTTNVNAGTCRLSTLGGELTGWVSGKVVVKHAPNTDVLLLDASMDVEGTEAAARYTASWTSVECDGVAIRAYLAGATLPRDCWCEVEWTDGEGTYSVAFPIKLAPTFNSDEDGAPEVDDPASEGWLTERAVRHDEAQTLSGPAQLQALTNLGITISEGGLMTLPTGHTIYLNAPA